MGEPQIAELPSWLHFVSLGYPSANLVVSSEGQRVLFDAGFGSDTVRTVEALDGVGVSPGSIDLLVNTHFHSDHVGGNSVLQSEHHLPIAAASVDAEEVNRASTNACLAEWLDQPVEQYHVDRPLAPGKTLKVGPADWEILSTPGHTPNHLSFYQPDEQVLVIGDAVHANDVGWINLAIDGPAAIDTALRTVERLADLPVRVGLPGHGPAVTNPAKTFASAHARYEKMRADPQRAAWHACKRIFAFALMINDGIPVSEVSGYLTTRPWLVDHAVKVFEATPEALADDLLGEMRRTGAVAERDRRLVCLTRHHHPAKNWLRTPGYPRDWNRG